MCHERFAHLTRLAVGPACITEHANEPFCQPTAKAEDPQCTTKTPFDATCSTVVAHDPDCAAQLARLERLLDKARAEFDDPVDFEGAGGPVSQPWKSRPRKKAAKAKPAG